MTELQLYKFIEENDVSLRWDGDELIAWISFLWISEFANLLGYDLLSDGGLEVNLQSDCIALDMTEICKYFGIEPENIFAKEEE